MSSDDLPPMPAAPPPSPAHEPAREPSPEPADRDPAPLPPEPGAGELVDSVPGAPSELVDSVPGASVEPERGGLVLPSDLPTWAPREAAADEMGAQHEPAADAADGDGDAGDTIPVATFLSQLAAMHADDEPVDGGETIAAGPGGFGGLIQPPAADLPGAPALPVAPAPDAPASALLPPPEWAAETQRGLASPSGTEPASAMPPQSVMPPQGFTPPPPPGISPPPPGFGPAPGAQPPGAQPPGAQRSHAGPSAGGRGKLYALIGGIIVLAALVAGGILLFHGSSKKSPAAASPSPAPVQTASSAVPPPTAAAVTPASPASPTADANLGGKQAKVLQSTVVGPLKSLTVADLHDANGADHCDALPFALSQFQAHLAERKNLLAQLKKTDVTGMENYQTWEPLLEQLEGTNVAFEQQLVDYTKDLEHSCDPATSTKNAHYQKALSILTVNKPLRKSFLTAYNPVAKRYNIPMQSAMGI